MMALTVRQPYAAYIADGHKSVEYRSWKTDYRGPLLITASAAPANITAQLDDGRTMILPAGCMVCVVDLVRITGKPGAYDWYFANPRTVKPLPVKGKQKLFRVPGERIEYLPTEMDWLDYNRDQ